MEAEERLGLVGTVCSSWRHAPRPWQRFEIFGQAGNAPGLKLRESELSITHVKCRPILMREGSLAPGRWAAPEDHVNEWRGRAERELIAAAAEAQEIFGDDELERHADEARRRLEMEEDRS